MSPTYRRNTLERAAETPGGESRLSGVETHRQGRYSSVRLALDKLSNNKRVELALVAEREDVAELPTDEVSTAAVSEGAEECPVIYADRVYLGLAGTRQLRVVCYSSDEPRAYVGNAA